ncbi:TIGR03862 family flavoprotein [Oceanicella actignis]|uniref:TIGR03862 family flavoprotein n=1 Tax=Oceanicella actignis TaxID=1189325 RepID=A0A1M7RS40_9RHOB|nr:TIGR03862 family flavoprotein [Oceanicella actignis]SET06824.1 hypothetical protein SAMN04488119_102477 [Oceanicella actignis]SHN48908.1 hypothetical protein SAMN05216200_10141 [Oceanicella actignis]
MLHEKDVETTQALVIGGGPAGLMAAEAIAAAGLRVIVAEAKPSFGRKLLMAGKSGLNLTKAEPPERFRAAFDPMSEALARALDAFGPNEVREWARGLGVETFVGSSGRVFPREMKASPLLRAWLRRLAGAGADLRARWRWTGFAPDGTALFDAPEGPRAIRAAQTVMALGGASWPRLGSDGAWTAPLGALGLEIAPLKPANMGFDAPWSETMRARFAGAPVKGAALQLGALRVRGEFVVTRHGIEGGAVYALSAALREALARGPAALTLDLVPDRNEADLARALARAPHGESLANRLRKRARLDPVRAALARELAPRRALTDPAALAAALKRLPLPVTAPRPIEEAISTAGGLRFDALDQDLAARALPRLRFAGEMLDWEAPTGGYLLTACLATGRAAGLAAARAMRAGG